MLPRMTTALTAEPAVLIQPTAALDRSLTWAGVAVLLLGLSMAVGDFFIVNVALPSIARTLDASSAALELIVAGYGTAYAVFLVPGGRLGDTRGRRGVFLVGIASFTLASALCGLAPNAAMLVGARIAQGVAAALLVPQVLAAIQAGLSGRDRQRALALYGGTLGAAAVTGQLLGGLIVQADLARLAWRPVFLVNVPIGLLAMALTLGLVPDTRGTIRARLDIRGGVLLAVALLSLLVPATMGRELGWPVWALALPPVVPLALMALIRHGRRMEAAGVEPLLPPTLLALSGLRVGLGVAVALFLALGGFFLTTALSLQDGLRFGPLEAGLTMLPYASALLLVSLTGRWLARSIGSRIVVLGAVSFTAGMGLLALEAGLFYRFETYWTLAPAMALIGAGQGLILAPLFGIALAGVPADRAGAASGLLSTTIQASLAVGAAGLGLVFFSLLGSVAGPVAFGRATAAAAGASALLGLAVAWLARRLPDTGIA